MPVENSFTSYRKQKFDSLIPSPSKLFPKLVGAVSVAVKASMVHKGLIFAKDTAAAAASTAAAAGAADTTAATAGGGGGEEEGGGMLESTRARCTRQRLPL